MSSTVTVTLPRHLAEQVRKVVEGYYDHGDDDFGNVQIAQALDAFDAALHPTPLQLSFMKHIATSEQTAPDHICHGTNGVGDRCINRCVDAWWVERFEVQVGSLSDGRKVMDECYRLTSEGKLVLEKALSGSGVRA